MRVVRGTTGALVLDDAYNANPGSAAAALAALAVWDGPGRRVAVLGDMLELDDTAAAHAALGRQAAEQGIDALVTVGPESEAAAEAARSATPPVPSVRAVADAAAALAAVEDLGIGPDDAVLVKASHAIGLALVVDALTGGRAS
jgi:UDP-N-acetylmuramoyl-tripeptide--D-alanyl-D-alanine ligase